MLPLFYRRHLLQITWTKYKQSSRRQNLNFYLIFTDLHNAKGQLCSHRLYKWYILIKYIDFGNLWHSSSSFTKGNCKDCKKPFAKYCFRSVLKNGEKRKLWIKALKREKKNKTAWLPGYSDRVCSIHFIDGIPTAANPVPILHLGYEKEVPKSRRELFRQPLQKKRTEKSTNINWHHRELFKWRN